MDDRYKNLKSVPMVFDIQALYINKHIRFPTREDPTSPAIPPITKPNSDASQLMTSLLQDIYGGQVKRVSESRDHLPSLIHSGSVTIWKKDELRHQSIIRLKFLLEEVSAFVVTAGSALGKELLMNDRLRRKQRHLWAAITIILCESTSALEEEGAAAGGSAASGFDQWLHAMRLVARLPQGIPPDFRKKLWLALADKHLQALGIDWPKASRICFSDSNSPDDGELGAQIVKDLHRTGCSLFCGDEGQENQAMLKRVLLAYARWNKKVGYCQGFNMIAALILEVMEKNEPDSLKVMIYLVEAVLPSGYFSDSLRGLAVDLAALRDLLRLRRPQLAAHLQKLQKAAPDGGVNEPPLTDVFAMQWFLTLYVTWLPRETALRIWDLVLLDGNELLLITALAIWDALQDRIVATRSADEFYTLMGALGAGSSEGGEGAAPAALAPDALAQRIAALGPAPELKQLRERHKRDQAVATKPKLKPQRKRGHRFFYSEEELNFGESEADKMAITPAFGQNRATVFMTTGSERLSLDIGALKRQYARLRERQRQAHVILAAACARQPHVPTSPASLSMNTLLLGKNAIVSSRGRRLGPPPGAIPPSRSKTTSKSSKRNGGLKGHKDAETISWKEENTKKSSSRRDSITWKDIKKIQENRSMSLEEPGDGQLLSETEANEIIASMKNRSHSESSSYSECSESSTSTSLCDEPNKMSDFDSESHSLSENTTQFPEEVIKSPIKTLSSAIADNLFVDYVQEFEQLVDKEKSDVEKVTDEDIDIEFSKRYNFSEDNGSKINFIINSYLEKRDKSKDNEANVPSAGLSFDSDERRIDTFYSNESLSPTRDPALYSKNVIKSSMYRPDIIDDLTSYTNFIQDIELSDHSASDVESPIKSDNGTDIIVSEDEPPIPLKIDKYFENSPEFFGARSYQTSDEEESHPRRSPMKFRPSRKPKKPDSLLLHTNYNDDVDITGGKYDDIQMEADAKRTEQTFDTSIYHIYTPIKDDNIETDIDLTKDDFEKEVVGTPKRFQSLGKTKSEELPSKSSLVLELGEEGNLQKGRRNSERALRIIQENSKILSRILTKQVNKIIPDILPESSLENNVDLSPIKPLTKTDFNFSDLYPRCQRMLSQEQTLNQENNKYGDNKIGNFGFENKAFIVSDSVNYSRPLYPTVSVETETLVSSLEQSLPQIEEMNAGENESKWVLPDLPPDRKISSDVSPEISNLNLSSNYLFHTPMESWRVTQLEDKKSPIGARVLEPINADQRRSKSSELIPRMQNIGPLSELTHIITSSISLSYEPSTEDVGSSTLGHCNSNDTLCQITSLDQVSTPISPKVFSSSMEPRDVLNLSSPNATYLNYSTEMRYKTSSDETSNAVTSILESETASSFSLKTPTSPSSNHKTKSAAKSPDKIYNPFPRSTYRQPRELGVRLGMYSRDPLKSPSK